MKAVLRRLSLVCAFVGIVSGVAIAHPSTDANDVLSEVEGQGSTTKATLSGVVQDTSGGVLPAATVVVKNVATGVTNETITNSTGLFSVPALDPGTYEATVSLSGFKTVRQENVRLEIGQSLELDHKMEVGQLEQVVTEEASSPLLDFSSASIGSVIQAIQLRELPLAGRHWAGLMLLAPGAINSGEGSHLSTLFVGRARDENIWTFDGIDATGV